MIPDPPNFTGDNVEPAEGGIHVAPQPPNSDGGSPIIAYEVWHYTNSAIGFVLVGTIPAINQVDGMTDTLTVAGQLVSFMTRCRNASGYSLFSPIVTVTSQGPGTSLNPPTQEVFDFITILRERLLLLIERYDPTRIIFRIGNTSKRDDKSRFGLNAKPAAGVVSDFPRLEIIGGRGVETGRKGEVFDDETGDASGDQPYDIIQTISIVVVHEAFNESANSKTDIQVGIAIRRGGLHLKDPEVIGSELPFVFGWNDISYERSRETVNASARGVTRISIPFRVKLIFSEAT